jgi:uncharacterized protein YegJ (DUF2314 family)
MHTLPAAHFFASIAFVLIAHSSSNAQTITEKADRGELAHMAREEPAMQRAFEKARATLDQFLQEARAARDGTSGYALKVAVSDGRNTEYFWVNRFSNAGPNFVGHLGNEPRVVRKYRFDERFQFDRAQIVDWTYIDTKSRRMVGNFTACALLTKEPPAQAEEFQRRYGLVCE